MGETLDVERLARAMEDVFPGWLDEAPGTAEAQAEMRSYAEQLDAAYRWLADSASPPIVVAPDRMHPQYEHGHRAALIMASKRIRALPKVHGPDIAISDEALSEREAIADFLDELSG